MSAGLRATPSPFPESPPTMTPPRVRFAPSPTGYLHVGGARTALYNWLVARAHPEGVFALRIEDTDRERSSTEMVEAILDGMGWLGLDWDEGPVHQADGVVEHRARALELLEGGKAYRDFTDPAELARIREEDPDRALRWPRAEAERLGREAEEEKAASGTPHAIRFRVPSGITRWTDRIHGEVSFRNDDLEDLVLLRADGTPTYNLAVVADDAAMEINLVLRGDDHLSNTPKQILLYEALGLPVPEFGHAPMILGPDGKRLSKRHGAAAVGEYEEQGILPEALMNFLALLGWSPGDDRELFSRDELVEAFALERVGTKAAVFDGDKLEWMNGRYMEARPPETLVDPVLNALGERRDEALAAARRQDPNGDGHRRLLGLVGLLQSRARTVNELADALGLYLFDEVVPDPKAVSRHWLRKPEMALDHLAAIHDALDEVVWQEESLETALRTLAEEKEVGFGRLVHPLRVALVGTDRSPGIFDVLLALGRERSRSRVKEAVSRIRDSSP